MNYLRMKWNNWWHGGDWVEQAYRRAMTLATVLFLLVIVIATIHWAAMGG